MRSENMVNEQSVEFHVRNARIADLAEIWTLVGTCAPYLTQHISYLYMRDLRYYGDTCAVALLNNKIIGWCSMFPAPGGVFFLHQLGVSPAARKRGVAPALVTFLMKRLGQHHGWTFRVEFTTDRKNWRAQKLFRDIAEALGMRLEKSPETIHLPDQGNDEELYSLTPFRQSVSIPVPEALAQPFREVNHA